MSHPETERLQELAAGRLESAEAAVLESHLVGCVRCREELGEWRTLYARLGELEPLAPAADFGDRVMARVRVRVPLTVRLLALLDRLLPTSTRGWALAGAFMAVPALVYVGAFAWLASRPWFSTSWLLSIAQEGVIAGVSSLSVAVWGWIAAQPLVQGALTTVASMGTQTLGLGAAVFGTAMVVSAWVLYRHLIRTPGRISGHATYAF